MMQSSSLSLPEFDSFSLQWFSLVRHGHSQQTLDSLGLFDLDDLLAHLQINSFPSLDDHHTLPGLQTDWRGGGSGGDGQVAWHHHLVQTDSLLGQSLDSGYQCKDVSLCTCTELTCKAWL